MEITVTAKYMVIPINMNSRVKRILFVNSSGVAELDISAHIDNEHPYYKTYVNVERYIGKTYDIVTEPECDYQIEFANCKDIQNNNDRYRPKIHYAPEIGWIGDPNGLFYADNLYHMLYQYNPVEPIWENMHWGHAVSTDLIKWKELEPALYPDTSGAIFTGSAFIDTKNDSKLSSDNKSVILLYYTSAGGVSVASKGANFTQSLAYSEDNGNTFTKYAKNPVMGAVCSENRDPKIVYSEEIGKYIMALYLEQSRYALFTSQDLLSWSMLQEIEINGEAECPDFYPLTTPDNEKVWILSGGSDYYIVGKMTRSGFRNLQRVRKYHFGDHISHAGKTFESYINGCAVRIVSETVAIPETHVMNQMGIPCVMSVQKIGGVYMLSSRPIDTIKNYYENEIHINGLNISKEGYTIKLDKSAYDITIRGENIHSECEISVFGLRIRLDPNKNKLYMLKTDDEITSMPLSYTNTGVDIRILIDTCGIELFVDGGLIYSTLDYISDYSMPYISIKAEEDTVIDDTNINKLMGIY